MSGLIPEPDDVLTQVIAALATRVDRALIDSSTFEIEQLAPGSKNHAPRAEYVVHVRTADPARLLMQFVPFSEQTLSGFAVPFVRGWLAAHFPDDAYAPVRFHLDVGCDPSMGNPQSLYRVLPFADARAQALLARNPVQAEHMQSFRPRAILLAGDVISGPSLAMMQTLQRLLQQGPFHTYLDGCAGSATLALLALRAGVRDVTSVDSAEFPSLRNLMNDYSGRWRYEVTDLVACLERHPPDAFDLISVDPFYGDMLRFLSGLSALKQLPHGRMLLNGGPSFLTNWHARVATAMKEIFDTVTWYDLWEERVYVASVKTDLGSPPPKTTS